MVCSSLFEEHLGTGRYYVLRWCLKGVGRIGLMGDTRELGTILSIIKNYKARNCYTTIPTYSVGPQP